MFDKMNVRKKAMEQMMREKPEISIKPKDSMESEEMDGIEAEKEGYESFMVSPEEKKMILALREKAGVGGESEESSELGEEEEAY
jgi:hypothetical protein